VNRFFLYILLIITGGITLTLIDGNSSVANFAIDVVAASSIILLEKIFKNVKYIWIWILTHTFHANRKIRLSISYLFKIKVDGKYLLVKGNRIRNQFQPVGGVFKRYRESFYALERLKVTDDNNMPIDDLSIDDLRVKLPAVNVISFLGWYESQLGREVSPYREFYEELIRTEILTQKVFPYLNYIHLRRHETGIRYSPHFKCYEILIAEIFEIRPTEDQMAALRELQRKSSDQYLWASDDTIERRGATPGTQSEYSISETSEWIL
jgi:hypothetical protein